MVVDPRRWFQPMQLASQQLTDKDRAAVAQAVATAEAKTSAEIVPVVATCSGHYERAVDIAGLWLGLAAMVIVWATWPLAPPEPGSWGHWPESLEAVGLVVAVVLGFIVGAVIASRVGWLLRLFSPRAVLRRAVETGARRAFYDARVHHTQTRHGLLLYVSLLERQAAVLADRDLVEQLGQARLDSLCTQLTTGLKQGSVAEALVQTITTAGESLSGPLPRNSGDVDELPNALVILDRPL